MDNVKLCAFYLFFANRNQTRVLRGGVRIDAARVFRRLDAGQAGRAGGARDCWWNAFHAVFPNRERLMYKRIFVAVDGSHSAQVALDEAIRIAVAGDGMITAACVVEHRSQLVDVESGFAEAGDDRDRAVEVATAALEAARAQFERHRVKGSVRALDAYGEDVATVLMRTAGEFDADLIVMGTRGRHGLRRLLLGSVAESLLRLADRPVLLRRDGPEPARRA
jgi:nucleotide-binding universal stress UspA family protein